MKALTLILLAVLMSFVPALYADTLFLRDGSVLQGQILNQAQDSVTIEHRVLGELTVPTSEVMDIQLASLDVYQEQHALSPEGLSVLTQLQRPVPARQGQAEQFNLLVPGQVVSVRDQQDRPLESRARSIGSNTLVTISYNQLKVDCVYIKVYTRQSDLLSPLEDGRLQLALNYTLAQAQPIRISVTYPAQMAVDSVSPTPVLQSPGLIVWEASLKRQQQFMPKMVLGGMKGVGD